MALKLLSSLYAVLLILCGLMFSASEALTETWLNTYYNGIFLVYIYVVAIVFLIVLQTYIIPTSMKKANNRQPILNPTPSPQTSPVPDYNGISKTLDNTVEEQSQYDTPNSETESTFEVVTTTRRKRYNSGCSMDTGIPNRSIHHSSGYSTDTGIPNPFLPDTGQDSSENEHEGSSFYLRLGVLFFGVGNMIYVILEIDYRLINVPEECPTDRFGWTFVLKLLFLLIQTFFLFKNPMVHITVWKRIYDFGCKHVIATNLSIWIRTLISEVEHAFHYIGYSVEQQPDVSTSKDTMATTGNDSCAADGELITGARPYLFPFVLEYSLIAMGVFIIMTNGIHHLSMPKLPAVTTSSTIEERSETLSSDSVSIYSSHFGPMQVKRRGTFNLNMKKSNKGLFVGIMVLAVAIVAIILFFSEANNGNIDSAQMNYLISDIVLHTLMLGAIIFAIYSLSKLKMKHTIHVQVDDILLLIAMSGSFIFELSIIISCSVYLSDGSDTSSTTILSLVSAIISVLQTVLQTMLITNGLRRTTRTMKQLEDLPGREAVTFLIVSNVTVWVFRTFQIKELEMGIQEDFYGTLAWLFILNLNLPLLLFFHFHSSVCLVDIWVETYRLQDPLDCDKLQIENTQATNMGFSMEYEQNNNTTIFEMPVLQNGQAVTHM